MPKNPIYLLDENVFIEAKNRYYAFDIAPPFWESLIDYSKRGFIQSIDLFKKKMEKYDDELAEWIKAGNMSEAFMTTDQEDVVAEYRGIVNWVQNNPQFNNAARATFANDPDGGLVAYAKAKDCIVITHETPKPAKSRVMIPNVCVQFKIPYRDTFQMMRELGIRFKS